MSDHDRKMAAVLVRLEMLSHGSCQAWNASGGHSGEPDDKIVVQVLRADIPPHIEWRSRYEKARSETTKAALVEAATDELNTWLKREKPAEASISMEDVLIEDCEGMDPATVGRRYNIDPAFVRRLRRKRGRGAEDGRDPTFVDGDRSERARGLRDQGLSTRQIATLLDCHQTQVMRWIRNSD